MRGFFLAVVKPLLEIRQPYLTREQFESGIWRLTGLKNSHAVEQLLRLADVYAVSQGPALIEMLRDRDRSRERWSISLPALIEAQNGNAVRKSPEPEHVDDADESDGYHPDRSEPRIHGRIMNGDHPKSAPVWEMPDGSLWQYCTGCQLDKPYDSFGSDASRWNKKATQCRPCRNIRQRKRRS